MRRNPASTAILIGALLAGCSAAATSPAPSPLPSTSATPSGSPVRTASPTPDSVSEFVPPTVATFEPSAGSPTESWDLVALGDSNVAGWGIRGDEPYSPAEAFPGVYAASLADELGVTITLHSYYPDQLGNEIREIDEWTDVVALDPAMRADLETAEVVVVLIGFHDMLSVYLYGSCMAEWSEWMDDCLDKKTAPMAADFAAMYTAIGELVPDATTVLVLDYGGTPQAYDRYGQDPAWPEIQQAMFGDWQDALRTAATAAGFTVVRMSRALFDEDGAPRYDPWEITGDGLHFNAIGHRILADQCLLDDGLGE